MAVIDRQTARVIPVSPRGRVLLLSGHDPTHPGTPFWFTIGGGIEAGETARAAAQRELWEETGIDVPGTALGELFHSETHTYSYAGAEIRASSVYFALTMSSETAVRPAGPSAGEIITAGRWWQPEALRSGPVANPDIPDIVSRAVLSLSPKD
ncbi:NUDIX domain-containing protein [Nakamurella sp. A5-74]|uniref:NUDIX domain-containing protein n=1 Tax=Nakamurella sp. A5-74 TaxID=3158264 RepID=A0AAU8DNI2_9ACTN